MYTISELLPPAVEGQKAFILDHGKIEDDGQLKYADDATSYGWNVHRYGKLKAGAVVLNRNSGKITKDRKWEIYGGGYVESVSEPDEDGNVIAVISHAFKIEPPIRQGDSFIENYEWKTPSKKKRKKPNSWLHFWDQYGMNEILYEDFIALMEDRPIISIDSVESIHRTSVNSDFTAAECEEFEKVEDFTVLIDEDSPKRSTIPKKRKFIGRKIDWEHENKSKQRTGVAGEEIVFDLLCKEAEEKGLQLPEHVSKTKGDGLGYDICFWDEKGREVHIEVKASKLKFSDGFELSSNELEASRAGFPYKIYFVYDLNIELKQCKIKIYDGPITEKSFKLVPSSYKVYLNY